jgi:hypothetical protein
VDLFVLLFYRRPSKVIVLILVPSYALLMVNGRTLFALVLLTGGRFSPGGGGRHMLASAKRPVAFECTARQAEEDLAAIAAEEYRYHQAMVLQLGFARALGRF